MFRPVAQYLRQQGWKEWSVAQIQTDAIVWWIFRPGERLPSIIGKVPRTDLDCRIARREAAALKSLAPLPDALRIPRLLFETEFPDGRFVFLQSAQPGQPIANSADSIPSIAAWLERFQQAAVERTTLLDAVRAAVSRCMDALPDLRPEEQELCRSAESLAAPFATLPASPVHGDFWAGNILHSSDGLAVIDWSNFHPGSPLEDLHTFVAAVADTREDVELRMADMWSAFFGETPLMRSAQAATTRILGARNFPAESLRALFALFLLTRIACIEFSNHAAWRLLAARYVRSGMPVPFTMPRSDSDARA